MGIIYNADEIFEIAIGIEKNGKAFYDMAADTVSEVDAQKLLRELSSWEDRHIELFKTLRAGLKAGLPAGLDYDADPEIYSYMKAAADSHVFVQSFDLSLLANRCKTAREALEIALRFEKDSVVYYATVKNLVPESLGRAEVSRIEDEEIRHVSILQKQIRHFTAE